MTRFYHTIKRLEAIEGFLWGLLAIVGMLVWLGGSMEEEPRVRVIADNNTRAAQELKLENVRAMDLSGVKKFEEVVYPPKRVGGLVTPQGFYLSHDVRLGNGRGDNFWCILVKNSCYSEQDVEEPKSFFVMLWKRWFSTEKDVTHPQDGDKVLKEEG